MSSNQRQAICKWGCKRQLGSFAISLCVCLICFTFTLVVSNIFFCFIKSICWVYSLSALVRDIILFYIKLFYFILYSDMIIVVLHIYIIILKVLRYNFCVIIFVTSLNLLIVKTRQKVVSSCKSNNLSLIVNYVIKL